MEEELVEEEASRRSMTRHERVAAWVDRVEAAVEEGRVANW